MNFSAGVDSDHPSLKLDNPTVWILKSKHVGDDLAWVTTQVSNQKWFGLSDYSRLELGMIWLGWTPKSQTGNDSAWVTTQVSNRGWFGLGDHPSLKPGIVIRHFVKIVI